MVFHQNFSTYYIVADIRCCHALEQCIDKISGRIQMRLAKRNRDKFRLFSNSDTSAVFMQIVISALCRHADDFRCWHNGRLADADTASDIHHGAENLHLIP